MNWFPRLTLFIILLLTGSAAGAVPAVYPPAAQTVDPCFGLSAADCAVIGDASARTITDLRSFQYTFTLAVALTGLEAADLGTDYTLNISGDGAFQRDVSDPTLSVAAALNFTGTQVSGGIEQSGSVQLIAVENVLYLQQDGGDWRGLSLADVLASPAFAAANLIGGSATGESTPLAIPGLTSALPEFTAEPTLAALLTVPGFITYARLPDETVDGQVLSPFSFTLDFEPLFASTVFQQTLDQVLTTLGTLDPEIGNLALIAPLLLPQSDLHVNLTQHVGTDDGFIRRLTLDLNGALDLNPLLGLSGDASLPPVTLTFAFDVRLSDLNQPVTLTAPADYTRLDPAELGLP